jgi:hypothetical protein
LSNGKAVSIFFGRVALLDLGLDDPMGFKEWLNRAEAVEVCIELELGGGGASDRNLGGE